MIQRKTLISGLLAAGLLPLIASAQSGNTGQTPAGQPPAGQAPAGRTPAGQTPQGGAQPGVAQPGAQAGGLTLQRGDKLVGMDVHDSAGQKIGRVDDLVLKPNGQVAYVVLSGTTPDTMAKEIVLPWKQVHAEMADSADRRGEPMAGIDRTNATDRLIFTAGKDRLAQAPSFDRAQWPKAGDTTVFTESDKFFGSETGAVAGNPDNRGRPVEAGASNATLFRLSQLRNQAVTDAAGTPSGTINQVVVDPITGRVNYVALATTSTAGARARTVALPWESVQASRRDDKDNFQVNVTPDKFQAAPEFIAGEEGWKQMSDPTFARDVYGYYSVRPYWNDAGADRGRNAPGTNPGQAPKPNNPDPKGNEPKRENPPRNPPPK